MDSNVDNSASNVNLGFGFRDLVYYQNRSVVQVYYHEVSHLNGADVNVSPPHQLSIDLGYEAVLEARQSGGLYED